MKHNRSQLKSGFERLWPGRRTWSGWGLRHPTDSGGDWRLIYMGQPKPQAWFATRKGLQRRRGKIWLAMRNGPVLSGVKFWRGDRVRSQGCRYNSKQGRTRAVGPATPLKPTEFKSGGCETNQTSESMTRTGIPRAIGHEQRARSVGGSRYQVDLEKSAFTQPLP